MGNWCDWSTVHHTKALFLMLTNRTLRGVVGLGGKRFVYRQNVVGFIVVNIIIKAELRQCRIGRGRERKRWYHQGNLFFGFVVLRPAQAVFVRMSIRNHGTSVRSMAYAILFVVVRKGTVITLWVFQWVYKRAPKGRQVFLASLPLLLLFFRHTCLGRNKHVNDALAKRLRAFVFGLTTGNNGSSGGGRARGGHAARSLHRTREHPTVRTTDHCCDM